MGAWFIALAMAAGLCAVDYAAELAPAVSLGNDGKLHYLRDGPGNEVPNFSAAGYRGGGVALPDAPVRVSVAPVEGDDGARIQAALDFVAGLPLDAQGLRGAVQLAKGRYEIAGQLKLDASGVVLRGAGLGADGTVLVAAGDDRRTLIEIGGKNDRTLQPPREIVGDYVPVGATKLRLTSTDGLRAGDRVIVARPSPAAWIKAVGMDDAPSRPALVWQPGTLDIAWDRIVTAVVGAEIALDAPLTTALERRFGGGTVTAYSWPGRIENVGVENLRCESEFDARNPLDEEHAWTAIGLDAVQNAWVRDMTAVHFVSSAVDVRGGAKWVIVQDCTSLAPVSEQVGYRRHTFHTSGQLTLFQRCRTEEGRHDFTVGYLAAGPNVFLDCNAQRAHGFSGSIGSWASGALFDNVKIDGGSLILDNLENWNQDVGWAAANSVIWQCTASEMICRLPPTAQNWAIGVWSKYRGDGHWSALNDFVKPDSLYRAQLAERSGAAALTALAAHVWPEVRRDTPTLEQVLPNLTAILAPRPRPAGRSLALMDGWLTAGGQLLVGEQFETPTWMGHMLPRRAPERGAALTRFVPGRSGLGLTDDFDELADAMIAGNQVAMRHHWGLWYDRRRDDHQMIRRADGDVWAPFFEQPWARTGTGTTWNGLSRYDLARFNPWYFRRLREFAEIGRVHGLVLIDEMYFQHNIIEAGAHWADFPWRPANSVQPTAFPEPPTYVGDKRIFMAEDYYDLSQPVRRELHRAFIRQCLANLADSPNVIHTTSDEFTGPLSFAQFWLDVVGEWEAETGRHPLIAISATKDVQDAILADPVRSRLIDVIDLKYWWRTETELYAPKGGESLSPRQHERLWKGGRPTATSIARMVCEYRERFPRKAIIAGLAEADGWAFAAAGGSLPKLPASTDPSLRAAIARMQPSAVAGTSPSVWALARAGEGYFIYAAEGGAVTLDFTAAPGVFVARRIDLATGRVEARGDNVAGGGMARFDLPAGKPGAVWLVRR